MAQNLAETLKQEFNQLSNEFEFKDIFLEGVASWFRNHPGCALGMAKNNPEIDADHIRIVDGQFYSQKKKYPGKFNYPYDEYVVDENVTNKPETHLRYYSEEDMQIKAQVLRDNGFHVKIDWVYGKGTLLMCSL